MYHYLKRCCFYSSVWRKNVLLLCSEWFGVESFASKTFSDYSLCYLLQFRNPEIFPDSSHCQYDSSHTLFSCELHRWATYSKLVMISVEYILISGLEPFLCISKFLSHFFVGLVFFKVVCSFSFSFFMFYSECCVFSVSFVFTGPGNFSFRLQFSRNL